MANRVVSIEVGIWHTKVCVTSVSKKNPHVYQAFVFRTPEDVIEDGYIRDKENFAQYLNNELLKHNVKERDVVFTLSSSKIVTREVAIPLVKDEKISGIVKTQANEYFPMDVSNYSITYKKMDIVEEDGIKEQKLLLMAVPDNLLNNYYSFAEQAGLHVETFDYIGNSTVQLLANKMPSAGGIIVEVDEQATLISIVAEGKLVFQRITPYGYGTTLTNMMNFPILGIKDEYEAFEFLQKNDVIHNEPQPDKFPNEITSNLEVKKEYLEEAYAEIRDSLSYHIRVVYAAVEYFQNQMKGSFKGNLYLVGRGTKIVGLEKMFGQEIPLPLWSNGYQSLLSFDKSYQATEVDAAEIVSTVGAVIKPIDIKPKDMKEKESRKTNLKTAYTVLGFAVFVALALVLVSSLRYLRAISDQREIEQGIENLSYIEEVYDLNNKVKAEYTQLAGFEERTLSYNDNLVALIEQLENELPTTMTVENLNVDEEKITMNVSCDVKMTAAAFLIHMQNITSLTNVTIPSMSEEEDATGNTIWKFSVLAYYTGAKGTSSGDATTTTSGDAVVNE